MTETGTIERISDGTRVGEVQLLATVAKELNRQAEEAGLAVDCIVSSSTTTGLTVAEQRFGVDRIFPCPLDFSWAVGRVLRQVEPNLLVLGELELWPNLLAAAAERGVPVAIVNGRMSPRSFRGFSRVRRLAAILRLAGGLDRSRSQQVRDVRAVIEDDRVTLVTMAVEEPQVDIWGAERRRQLFEQVFGMPVTIGWEGHPTAQSA